jgi:MFS family permease
MPTGPDATAPNAAVMRISLNVVLGAAIADAVFLVGVLVAIAAGGGAIGILGPLYLLGFVYLLYLAAKGAMDRRWGWSYFVLVAVTLGPIGAIIGERRMRARLPAAAAEPEPKPKTGPPGDRPTRKEQRRAATERRRADR